MTPRESPDDPLRWQAFRYVADELRRDERLAFEARLADDPCACAAVAEAVELLGACLALDPPLAAGRRSRWAPFGPPLALAAAAAAVALALLPLAGGRPGGDDPGPGIGGEMIALEHAWSRLRRSDLVDGATDPTAAAPSVAEEPWDVELPADEEAEGSDPPSWLIAAVALAGREDEGLPGPLEN